MLHVRDADALGRRPQPGPGRLPRDSAQVAHRRAVLHSDGLSSRTVRPNGLPRRRTTVNAALLYCNPRLRLDVCAAGPATWCLAQHGSTSG